MPNLATQIHYQAIEDAIQVLRYEAGLSRRVLAHLRGLEKDLLGEYLNAGNPTSRRALKRLLDDARAAIADRFGAAQGVYDEEIPQFTSIQANRLIDGLNGLVKVDIFRMSLTADQVNAIASDVLIQGAPSAEWWAAQEEDIMFKFKNIVRQGMTEARTGDEMARTVRDLMGTSMRNAQSLVRTSVITVNNAAHEAMYQANSDIINGETWVSTLDPRTCVACGALDGVTWKLGESHPAPSLHWACRCSLTAKPKSWEQLAREAHGNSTLAKKLDQMDGATRASMDGQVSAAVRYEDWLASKPEAFQREILGPARYRLLESGKLTLRDLTDQRGNELTLKELARL